MQLQLEVLQIFRRVFSSCRLPGEKQLILVFGEQNFDISQKWFTAVVTDIALFHFVLNLKAQQTAYALLQNCQGVDGGSKKKDG